MTDDASRAAERTGLAWQRTALAVAAGGLVAARIAWETSGAVALVGLVTAVPLALWVLAASRSRYRPGRTPRVGVEAALLSAAVLALGAGELLSSLAA